MRTLGQGNVESEQKRGENSQEKAEDGQTNDQNGRDRADKSENDAASVHPGRVLKVLIKLGQV